MIEKFRGFLRSDRFHLLVFGVIILNAIVLGLETSKVMMARWGPQLQAIENVFLSFFVLEIIVRLLFNGRHFIRNGWDTADFIIVACSIDPHFRSLSILRMFRILSRLNRIDQILRSLKRVGLQILVITGIMIILFYTFGVIGVRLYGLATPQHFGGLDWSLLTLAQIMVGDNYGDIIRSVVEHKISGWLYFTITTVAFTFVVVNLFIGVIVDAIQAAVDEKSDGQDDEHHRLLKEVSERLDQIERKLDDK